MSIEWIAHQRLSRGGLREQAWFSHGLVFLTLCLLSFTMFYDAYASMVTKWSQSGTYAHGFLIGPISMVLIYQKRDYFQSRTIDYSILGIVGLIGISLIWFCAQIAFVGIVSQWMAVLSIMMAFYACFGYKLTKTFQFPLLYLLFCIPFGNFITPTLQNMTASFVVHALEWSNISVFYEGWHITTTEGEFEVARACSGIRYLIATVSLGALYAHLSYQSLSKKLTFMMMCVIVPIVANFIRAYLIIVIAHMTSLKYAVGVDHLIYGWIFFGLVILALFYVGSLFAEPRESVIESIRYQLPKPARQHILMLMLGSLAIMSGPILKQTHIVHEYHFEQEPLVLPASSGEWTGPHPGTLDWKPRFIGVNQDTQVRYQSGENLVDVYVGVYHTQSPQKELISSENAFFDTRGWSLLERRTLAMNGKIPNIQELDIHNKSERRLVWTWYVIAGITTTNPVMGKILEGYSVVTGDSTPSGVIVCSVPYEYYPGEARKTLMRFVEDMAIPLTKPLMSHE